MTEPQTTDTLYKPVPQGYRGWSCGTDANGECLCGEQTSIAPSMVVCPHAVLVPDAPQTTLSPFMERFLHGSDEKIHVEEKRCIPHPGHARAKHLATVLRAVMKAIEDQDYDGAYVMCREALK